MKINPELSRVMRTGKAHQQLLRRNTADEAYTDACTACVLLVILACVLGVVMLTILIPSTARADEAATRHYEGYSSTLYTCPAGRRTIGYGFNVDDPTVSQLLPADVVSGTRPITRAEADRVFGALYQRAAADARDLVGGEWDNLAPHRQEILTDMSYNLGRSRLAKFRRMLAAVRAHDVKRAAAEMQDSRWYNQTGQRARDHVNAYQQEG